MLLLALLAVPVVFGVAMFFVGRRRITPLELAIQLGVVGVLIVGGYYRFRWSGLQDTEIWNGRVASKPSGSMGCCHSYKCNCRQECKTTTDKDNKKTTTCAEVCDTCYKHGGDYYYEAYSSNDEQVFRSGCWGPDDGSPAEWSQIRIGEPTAVEHQFTNYVLADPEELVARPTRAFDDLPAYPRVEGWRARRFLFAGIPREAQPVRLDAALDELNAELGASKQVNVIVVVTGAADPAYFAALAWHWHGGKKNDVVLVIGAPAFPAIAWARVMAWNEEQGGEDAFKGGLAARVEALGRFDGDAVLAILRDEITRGYRRRSFSQLEYLIARAQPPGWAVALLFALGLVMSALLHWLFWGNRARMRGRAPHEHVQRWVAKWRGRARSDVPPDPTGGLRVSVQRVDAIEPIPGADRIVLATIAGRTVIVSVGELEAGDLCVLFVPGCVLPAEPRALTPRVADYRVAVRRVFGITSQGFAMPIAQLGRAVPPGLELADELGVGWDADLAADRS